MTLDEAIVDPVTGRPAWHARLVRMLREALADVPKARAMARLARELGSDVDVDTG